MVGDEENGAVEVISLYLEWIGRSAFLPSLFSVRNALPERKEFVRFSFPMTGG